MTRPLIVATFALASAAYPTGCGVVCRGPACADEWDVGRAWVLPGTPDRAELIDAALHADPEWVGTVTEGPDWTLDGAAGVLLVGTSASSQVWSLDADAGGDLIGTPWTDGTSFGFGHALDRGAAHTWVGNPEADLASGALYRYPHGADTPDVVLGGGSTGDRLGERVWGCGDLDADGVDDLAASIPWFEPAADFPLADPEAVPALAGAVLVVLSTELAEPDRPLWELGRLYWGAGAGDQFGAGLACDRDLDADGVADLAVGAPYAGSEDDGAVYFFPGVDLPASGPGPRRAGATLLGEAGAWLGFDVDTFVDPRTDAALLTAGAPGHLAGAGAVWIVEVTPAALRTQARLEADATAEGSHLGRFVNHGDHDGDGREDLIVGAPDWKEGKNGYDAGRVLVLYGGGASWTGTVPLEGDTTFTTDQPFARLGRHVRAVDLDADGDADLLTPTRTAILP